MHSNSKLGWAMAAVLCVTGVYASAQSTTTSPKQFEVIAVQGNDVVVRLDEGTRELKVPDDFRFLVDGEAKSVHDLKPGMIGTATISPGVKMTPVTVTEIKDGKVVQASGSEIVVQTENGMQTVNPRDLDPLRDVEVTRAGKAAQMSEVRVGDRLTATIIRSVPQVAEKPAEPWVAPRAQAEPTPAPPAYEPEPAPVGTSGYEPTQEATTAEQLPRTASALPLAGVLGVGSLFLGGVLAARRRRKAA